MRNNNPETITSAKNPKIKEVTALQSSSSLRREKGLFVVEGRREVSRCIDAGYQVRTLFICPEIAGEKVLREMESLTDKTFHVSEPVYDRLAYRGGTEGILAVIEAGSQPGLETLVLPADPLVVIVEAVEKPGNIGAMLRTADAAGVDAFIICDPHTDLYNPNLIRASLGGLFSTQVAVCNSEAAIPWLKKHGISILTAQLQDSELYYQTDMTRGIALVFGTEADGLSDLWRKASDARIRIPMLGRVDSLNVSASMAILCYEAVRQRHNTYAHE